MVNSKRKTVTGSQRGFTIVELVITIVLIGIIVPAVALALNNLTTINYQARDQALADLAAQNKVENLRSQGYNSLSLTTVDFSNELPVSMGSPKSASYTVSAPLPGLKQVDISISYTEYKVSQTVRYSTYISELGVGQ